MQQIMLGRVYKTAGIASLFLIALPFIVDFLKISSKDEVWIYSLIVALISFTIFFISLGIKINKYGATILEKLAIAAAIICCILIFLVFFFLFTFTLPMV